MLANGRRSQCFGNGRQPQYFRKWKTTSKFWQIEDDLNILANERQPQQFGKMEDDINFLKMEDNLNILVYGKQTQHIGKLKMTSIF